MVADPSLGFKHALVTGATGIVGVPLCRALVRKGVKVTAFSRKLPTNALSEEVVQVSGSILDKDMIAAAANGADVIFHAAAAVHGSASTYSDFERVNVTGTRNVIEVAEDSEATLVHVSTVNVEGFRSGVLKDAYAETKSIAEELVVTAIDDGLKASIVRPAAVYGNEEGRSGLIVDRLLAGSLKVLPAPSRRISPVWAGDLADALINAGAIVESGRTYTVAGPTLTTGEFVREVCTAAGLKNPFLTVPGRLIAIPLRLAWQLRWLSRWTPPVTVESLLNGSSHDGTAAAVELAFGYTPISDIFGKPD